MSTPNGQPALKTKHIEEEAHHIANGESKVNAWSDPGRAAFDFRSMHAQCSRIED